MFSQPLHSVLKDPGRCVIRNFDKSDHFPQRLSMGDLIPGEWRINRKPGVCLKHFLNCAGPQSGAGILQPQSANL